MLLSFDDACITEAGVDGVNDEIAVLRVDGFTFTGGTEGRAKDSLREDKLGFDDEVEEEDVAEFDDIRGTLVLEKLDWPLDIWPGGICLPLFTGGGEGWRPAVVVEFAPRLSIGRASFRGPNGNGMYPKCRRASCFD